MTTRLDEKAKEESTFSIRVSFKDENGDPITPTAISWTLTDKNGNVINEKLDQSISPDTSVIIVLSGDDLALVGSAAIRYLTVGATYDSTIGSNLPLKDQASFQIENLVAIPEI